VKDILNMQRGVGSERQKGVKDVVVVIKRLPAGKMTA